MSYFDRLYRGTINGHRPAFCRQGEGAPATRRPDGPWFDQRGNEWRITFLGKDRPERFPAGQGLGASQLFDQLRKDTAP